MSSFCSFDILRGRLRRHAPSHIKYISFLFFSVENMKRNTVKIFRRFVCFSFTLAFLDFQSNTYFCRKYILFDALRICPKTFRIIACVIHRSIYKSTKRLKLSLLFYFSQNRIFFFNSQLQQALKRALL